LVGREVGVDKDIWGRNYGYCFSSTSPDRGMTNPEDKVQTITSYEGLMGSIFNVIEYLHLKSRYT
jgi:hypothetical protein